MLHVQPVLLPCHNKSQAEGCRCGRCGASQCIVCSQRWNKFVGFAEFCSAANQKQLLVLSSQTYIIAGLHC